MVPPDATVAEPSRKRHGHRWLPWLLVVLVLELVAGVGVIAAARGVFKHDTVPSVVGLRISAADSALRRAGLTPEVSSLQYSGVAAAGRVIFQLPSKGAREKAGSIVKMVVSQGRHPTVLPSLSVGMTEASANAALRHAHLVPQFSRSYSETVTVGSVVSWSSLAGTRVFYGDKVSMVISKGPAPQTIPTDLSGGVLTWQEAESALTNLHLKPIEHQEYSVSVPAGYVVTTNPVPGATVQGHTTVLVFVSEGPPFVKVPPIIGDSESGAEQTLSSLGLKWQFFGPPGATFVLGTYPGEGTSLRVGSTVVIYLTY